MKSTPRHARRRPLLSKLPLYGDGGVNPLAGSERLQGFLSGLKRCRLKAREDMICPEGKDLPSFFEALAHNHADAICCLNDLCAGNLMHEAQKCGILLARMRISGFDNLPLGDFLPYPLTTVQQPLESFGREAARLLIRQIENPQFALTEKNLRSKIIERNAEPNPMT